MEKTSDAQTDLVDAETRSVYDAIIRYRERSGSGYMKSFEKFKEDWRGLSPESQKSYADYFRRDPEEIERTTRDSIFNALVSSNVNEGRKTLLHLSPSQQ